MSIEPEKMWRVWWGGAPLVGGLGPGPLAPLPLKSGPVLEQNVAKWTARQTRSLTERFLPVIVRAIVQLRTVHKCRSSCPHQSWNECKQTHFNTKYVLSITWHLRQSMSIFVQSINIRLLGYILSQTVTKSNMLNSPRMEKSYKLQYKTLALEPTVALGLQNRHY